MFVAVANDMTGALDGVFFHINVVGVLTAGHNLLECSERRDTGDGTGQLPEKLSACNVLFGGKRINFRRGFIMFIRERVDGIIQWIRFLFFLSLCHLLCIIGEVFSFGMIERGVKSG